MPIVSGGGGGTFNGGTITTPENIAPTSDTVSDLLSVVAPTDYESNSPTGRVIRATAQDGTHILVLDTAGDLDFRSPTGEGSARFQVMSVDTPGVVAALSTSTGIYFIPVGGGFAFMANGSQVSFKQNAATADGNLNAGDCSIWFDQTNGAAKFMLKGKTANGTVVAASVAMS